MVLSNYVVWKNKVATPISKIQVGDKVAVLNEDSSLAEAEVKSILLLYSSSSIIQLSSGQSLTLPLSTTVLCETGMIHPQKGDLLVCGTYSHRVQSVKESLTLKKFYDIMLDVDLPLIIQDGYCVKVRSKK